MLTTRLGLDIGLLSVIDSGFKIWVKTSCNVALLPTIKIVIIQVKRSGLFVGGDNQSRGTEEEGGLIGVNLE